MKKITLKSLRTLLLSILMLVLMIPASSYSAYAAEIKLVTSVNLKIAAPVCGSVPSLEWDSENGRYIGTNQPEITIIDGEGVEVEETMWLDPENREEDIFTGTFVGGKEYLAIIRLISKDGYEIPDYRLDGVGGGPADDPTVDVTLSGGRIEGSFTGDGIIMVRAYVTAEHDWDNGTVTTKPTTAAEGVKTYTCKHCKATKTEKIPKLQQTLKVGEDALKTTKLTAKGRKTLALSWDAVPGADGYDVFFALCNHGKNTYSCTKSGNVKAGQPLVWTKSGLKSGTSYKGYVKAYVMQNGKKKYIKTSPSVHAYTGNGDKTHSNVKNLKLKKSSVTIAKGKKYQIKATLTKFNKNKMFMSIGHVPRLRYYSTDKKVATVNAKGKVTAKGPGSCVIFVVTHNGISKKLKVTVK